MKTAFDFLPRFVAQHSSTRSLSLAVACLLVAVPSFAAINIPLTVQEAIYSGGAAGIARSNEPVTVGVPLPDSAGIATTNTLALSGATAAQFSVEGYWPSGNIKWLKIRAIVPSLAAGGSTTLTLTDSGTGNFGGSSLAVDNGATITISTGAATFTVRKANFNVIDQAVVGTKTVVTSGASQGLVVIGPDPTTAYPANATCLPTTGGSACATIYASANDPTSTATIEENGPAMAIVKASGRHLDAAGHAYMNFTVRLYFYKGASAVKLSTVLRNADYGAAQTFANSYKGFQGYEVRLTPTLSGTLNYTIANDTATPTTGTLAGSDYAYLYQAESALMKSSQWCASGTGCVPYTTLSGYSILQNGTSLRTGTSTNYPAGWADISDASGAGIEIGQNQLAAYGNKSLEFRNGGTDIRIGLWAAENNTTSTSSTTANAPYYQAWPQWSIQDAYVSFHAAAPASASSDFLRYQHPLIARATPAYYNSTGALMYPLLDPTEESSYYNSVVASASPAVASVSTTDLGVGTNDSLCTNTICVWRFYPWATGGGANQMEFRLSRLLNFLRRGQAGSYVAAANFYKFVAEQAFPYSDGFNWRDKTSAEVQQIGYPTAISTNGGRAHRNWAEMDQEHANWQGLPTYYFLTGDELYRDAVIEGPKDNYLNTTSSNNWLGKSGALWNGRSVGNALKSIARLYDFLSSIQDPDANTLLTNGQTLLNVRLAPDFCAYSGYPAGCTPDPTNNNGATTRQIGVSRVRGIPYEWGDTSVSVSSTCGTTIPASVRSQAPLFVSIELEGLWEYLKVRGPGWANYNQFFDLAYGITQWSFNEMFVDNGQQSWTGNGFRYKMAVDYANSCNAGLDYSVENEATKWYPFYILHQYEGSTTAWKHKFDMVLQRNISDQTTEEFFNYTIGNVIYSLNHPIGVTLATVPLTGFTDNGGGSYTISWTVPANAQSYRVKWGAKRIVDWIGFDSGAYKFIGDPTTTMNWFAATDAANIPVPSGTTQSMTVSTGVTGLTATNFMIKAYVGSATVGTPSPSDVTPPTVSMTAPAANATVSGNVTVSATAADNVGVASVQFRADGTNIGAPVAGPGPYTITWNTTGVSNATHSLTAMAVDAAGNSTVSAAVSVTVNNTVSAPVISAVAAGALTSSSATITWLTDVASDTQVAYGTTTAYGATTALVTTMVTSHTAIVSGLAASTTYHFKVMSRNQQGTLSSSSDFSFTTLAAPVTGGGSGSVPLNSWTRIAAHGFPAQIFGYDKTVYVNSRNIHCIWGGYHQTLSSEPDDGLVCYSYAENRWTVLQNNGMWSSSHTAASGHATSLMAYMADRDTLAFATDGSGSNSPQSFNGHWWWYDVAALNGQERDFSPRPWLGATTPVSALAYDTFNTKLVLFPDLNGVVEVCNPSTNSCAAPATTGTAPPGSLGNLSMVFNPTNNLMYVFGGGGNDIYTFDVAKSVWSRLTTTCSGVSCTSNKPPARLAAGFAYSPVDNIFLMAGGVSAFGGTAYTDTWTFNPTTLAWTQVVPIGTYVNDSTNTTFDRLTYDAASNVFLLVASGGASNYLDGSWNSYTAAVYAFAYSTAANYGRTSITYTPPAGSLNRVTPTASSQSWTFDPAITSSGSLIYAGWVETGTPFDTSVCGLHHPYIQSSPGTSSWTPLPGGTQAAACTAIDPEPTTSPGNSDDSKLKVAVVNGTLWETHEKWNNGTISSSAWAKSWTGSAWSGGAIKCFSGTCSTQLAQSPQSIIGVGSTPTVAVLEWNHLYDPESYLYVAQWNGTAWAALGGKLNAGGAGSRVLSASLATDGSNPSACWSEELDGNGDRKTVTVTPQIRCGTWNGTAWSRWGTASLNQSATSWAYDPSVVYMAGKFYVAWVERTTAGPAKLYACRWDGTSCTLIGGGALNINASTGWAAHPSLATDGTTLFLGWEEQPATGQHSNAYVKRWDGTAWTQSGGVLNADPVNGSVEGMSLAVAGGNPTAIWTELTYGNLRQVYVKQLQGTTWSTLGTTAPTVQLSCDLNGDGIVNSTDVQLATNQALGITPCSSADLQQTGQCTVIDVQRVINASLGGPCIIGR